LYKNVSLPSVAAFQSSWILLAITLVVGPNLPFGGLACGFVLGPLPSPYVKPKTEEKQEGDMSLDYQN